MIVRIPAQTTISLPFYGDDQATISALSVASIAHGESMILGACVHDESKVLKEILESLGVEIRGNAVIAEEKDSFKKNAKKTVILSGSEESAAEDCVAKSISATDNAVEERFPTSGNDRNFIILKLPSVLLKNHGNRKYAKSFSARQKQNYQGKPPPRARKGTANTFRL